MQKQPSRSFLKKRCSENVQQIYSRTPMPKCDFNKVALQLYWNHTLAWVYCCTFAAYFQNTFSQEHLWTATSGYAKGWRTNLKHFKLTVRVSTSWWCLYVNFSVVWLFWSNNQYVLLSFQQYPQHYPLKLTCFWVTWKYCYMFEKKLCTFFFSCLFDFFISKFLSVDLKKPKAIKRIVLI